MWVCLILIPSSPEKRPNNTCALDCSVWQVQRNYHRFVDFGPETDNVRCEGFGVLGLLLKSRNDQLHLRQNLLVRTLIVCNSIEQHHLEASAEQTRPEVNISQSKLSRTIPPGASIPFDVDNCQIRRVSEDVLQPYCMPDPASISCCNCILARITHRI